MAYNMADCLPPIGMRVLVWDKKNARWVIDRLHDVSQDDSDISVAFEFFEFYEVTHWLKLPQKPDLDKRGRMPGEDFSL